MQSFMYSIIGGDGKEYGPVTVEQVRAWMAAGRANLATKVKLVGTDEWKSIADVPEIMGSSPAASRATASGILEGNPHTKLDILSCYSRSWDLLKANFWPLVGVNFMIVAILALIAPFERKGFTFIGPMFNGVISAGLFYYFVLKIRGQRTRIADAFAGFTRAFMTLVVIGVLVTVFFTVGVICLILPGIYLIVAYAFAQYLAVDKGMGFWEAMESSRRIITKNWWQMFGLLLLVIPLLILGLLALGVGIFVALPVMVGALAYAYEDLCNPAK
jgi:uncharacterized membrane protein